MKADINHSWEGSDKLLGAPLKARPRKKNCCGEAGPVVGFAHQKLSANSRHQSSALQTPRVTHLKKKHREMQLLLWAITQILLKFIQSYSVTEQNNCMHGYLFPPTVKKTFRFCIFSCFSHFPRFSLTNQNCTLSLFHTKAISYLYFMTCCSLLCV